jgi:hypothetical protein
MQLSLLPLTGDEAPRRAIAPEGDERGLLARRTLAMVLAGGQKLSGYGKDMSMYGLEDYTSIRHVMFKH